VSLQRRGECGEGQMTSREREERECGVLSARDGLGLGCTLMETIGGFGRRAGDGVVVSVQ
jgi:hypothetical protein